jgi:hypothetical protein
MQRYLQVHVLLAAFPAVAPAIYHFAVITGHHNVHQQATRMSSYAPPRGPL